MSDNYLRLLLLAKINHMYVKTDLGVVSRIELVDLIKTNIAYGMISNFEILYPKLESSNYNKQFLLIAARNLHIKFIRYFLEETNLILTKLEIDEIIKETNSCYVQYGGSYTLNMTRLELIELLYTFVR